MSYDDYLDGYFGRGGDGFGTYSYQQGQIQRDREDGTNYSGAMPPKPDPLFATLDAMRASNSSSGYASYSGGYTGGGTASFGSLPWRAVGLFLVCWAVSYLLSGYATLSVPGLFALDLGYGAGYLLAIWFGWPGALGVTLGAPLAHIYSLPGDGFLVSMVATFVSLAVAVYLVRRFATRAELAARPAVARLLGALMAGALAHAAILAPLAQALLPHGRVDPGAMAVQDLAGALALFAFVTIPILWFLTPGAGTSAGNRLSVLGDQHRIGAFKPKSWTVAIAWAAAVLILVGLASGIASVDSDVVDGFILGVALPVCAAAVLSFGLAGFGYAVAAALLSGNLHFLLGLAGLAPALWIGRKLPQGIALRPLLKWVPALVAADAVLLLLADAIARGERPTFAGFVIVFAYEIVAVFALTLLGRFAAARIARVRVKAVNQAAASAAQSAPTPSPPAPPPATPAPASPGTLTATVPLDDQGSRIVAKGAGAAPTDLPTIVDFVTKARERGWSTIYFTGGSAEFKANIWLEARRQGLSVSGYEPPAGLAAQSVAWNQRVAQAEADARAAGKPA